MQTLLYRSLPAAVVDRARRELRDDFGHTLTVQPGEVAPCRNCLRMTEPHEPLILFAYRPSGEDYGPYSETGPVFIHADACEPYARTTEFPSDFQTRSLVLRAYDAQHRIADSVVAQPGTAQDAARALLDDPRIQCVHARNVAYGCFNFTIERG